jgi:hypothetical protein
MAKTKYGKTARRNAKFSVKILVLDASAKYRLRQLDDRFHETSIGEANQRGTEEMLVDSSFEDLNEERQHGNMAASA